MRSSGRFKTWKKSGKLPPTNEVCGRVTQERVPKFVQVYSRPFSHAARSPRAQKWARGKERRVCTQFTRRKHDEILLLGIVVLDKHSSDFDDVCTPSEPSNFDSRSAPRHSFSNRHCCPAISANMGSTFALPAAHANFRGRC